MLGDVQTGAALVAHGAASLKQMPGLPVSLP